jgi:hypothetical protein
MKSTTSANSHTTTGGSVRAQGSGRLPTTTSAGPTTTTRREPSSNTMTGLELPQIPIGSFMDSFGSTGDSGMDLPLLPSSENNSSHPWVKQSGDPREPSDPSTSSFDPNLFSVTSSSSPDRLASAKGMAQHRSSPKPTRSYKPDQRTSLGIVASSSSSAPGTSSSDSVRTGIGSGKRHPPERLDLESPNRSAYQRSSTGVSSQQPVERRRIVTEPGQNVSVLPPC